MEQRKRLGDILVDFGLISKEQLESTLKQKGENQKLGDALLERGLITEQQLIEVLEFQLGIPHVSLYQYPFETQLFSMITKEMAKRNLIVPLKKEEDKLYIAMADPMDYYLINDLEIVTGFQIVPTIATKDDIIRVIDKYYDMDEGFEELLTDQSSEKEVSEDQVIDRDSPIVKLVNQLLTNAATSRASDIHFDPHETKLVIRYRVDGILHIDSYVAKAYAKYDYRKNQNNG